MKNSLTILLICFGALACSKSKHSNGSGSNQTLHTTYTASINVGGKVYNTSNYTDYNNTTSSYQWDGLSLYFGFPACSAHLDGDSYQVSVWDTAQGVITSQPLLQFDMPNQANFTNYNSPIANIYFLDTAYTGTAIVSASITNSGHHTGSGSISLQGLVVPAYSEDTIPFSASINFTNALNY